MSQRKAIAIILATFTTLCPIYLLEGAGNTRTWNGNASDDLTNSNNWTPGFVPTGGDKAVFDSSMSYTPFLDSANTFNVQLVDFTSGDTTGYTFTIQGLGTNFNFTGTDATVGDIGVKSSSLHPQTFNIVNEATLTFEASANALISGSSGSVTYNVGDPTGPNPGRITFTTTSGAGSATFTVAGSTDDTTSIISFDKSSGAELATFTIGSASPITTGRVTFSDTSSAESATISVVGGILETNKLSSLEFFQASDAGNAAITIGENSVETSGFITFHAASSAAASTITAIQNSEVFFIDASTASGATINLGDDTKPAYCYFSGSADAGGASINAVNGSQIFFANNSNAQGAIISLDNGLCSFQNINSNGPASSEAGTSFISAVNDSQILFTGNSSAQGATIQAGFLSSGSATIDFYNNATADTASIFVVEDSTITFHNSSNASGSAITLGTDHEGQISPNGTLLFTDNSSAGLASITANQASTILFTNSATADTCAIGLNDTSTLTFELDAASGASAIAIGPSATAEFEQSGDDVFTGVVRGTGQFNKTGTGKLTMTADSSLFNGTTTISGGNLALNGKLGGSIFVNAAGILSGNGTVTGDLTVNDSGTIAPGNSIGTLNVTGDYNQTNSTYQVQVDGSGQASKIDISGIATLGAGAGVVVIPLSLPVGEVYTSTILHADGGLTGTFSSLTVTNPLLAAGLSYDADNAYLTYQNALTVNAVTPNQQAVANQLVTITDPIAQESAVLTALVELPAARQSKALSQMSATPYASLLMSAQETNQQFIRRLYDPLRPLITANTCCCDPCCCDPCYSSAFAGCSSDLWIAESWEGASYHGNSNASGFNKSGFEISFGVQSRLTREWTVGIAGSYEGSHYRYDVGAFGKSHIGLGALYALYRPKCFYVVGDLVLGGGEQKIHRCINIGTFNFSKHSKPTIFQSSLYVESGFDLWYERVLIQPFLGLEFDYLQRCHFGEHSSNPFLDVCVHARSRGIVSSRLGLHFSGAWNSCFSYAIDTAWQCRLSNFNHSIVENFTTFGDSFTVNGTPQGRNSFDALFNVSYKLPSSWTIYAEAIGQQWENSSSWSILGGVGYTW